MTVPARHPVDFTVPPRRQHPPLTYAEARARAPRGDLWPAFRAAPAPLPCDGGDDCDCHDDDWPPGTAEGLAAWERDLVAGGML